ncbi:MAG: nucleotidyltransferase substrate binding protein [Salinisphaera sp.]|nr:nucleotidyltransferase substrate binding protein [Salinisphaera sp.]
MTDASNDHLERMAQALRRLREAVALQAPSRLEVDGAIQRFEFSYELAWKALRNALATEGREVNSPRQSFRAAYQLDWIEDEGPWLEMINDRNLTTHTYNEKLAQQIHGRIPDHLNAMETLYSRLRDHR